MATSPCPEGVKLWSCTWTLEMAHLNGWRTARLCIAMWLPATLRLVTWRAGSGAVSFVALDAATLVVGVGPVVAGVGMVDAATLVVGVGVVLGVGPAVVEVEMAAGEVALVVGDPTRVVRPPFLGATLNSVESFEMQTWLKMKCTPFRLFLVSPMFSALMFVMGCRRWLCKVKFVSEVAFLAASESRRLAPLCRWTLVDRWLLMVAMLSDRWKQGSAFVSVKLRSWTLTLNLESLTPQFMLAESELFLVKPSMVLTLAPLLEKQMFGTRRPRLPTFYLVLSVRLPQKISLPWTETLQTLTLYGPEAPLGAVVMVAALFVKWVATLLKSKVPFCRQTPMLGFVNETPPMSIWPFSSGYSCTCTLKSLSWKNAAELLSLLTWSFLTCRCLAKTPTCSCLTWTEWLTSLWLRPLTQPPVMGEMVTVVTMTSMVKMVVVTSATPTYPPRACLARG